jgi:CheY-like chemotaxis protein
MALRTRDNRAVCVEGKVVRCQHVQRHVHEIGLQFDSPIRLGDFVASALRMGAEVEASKELPQLSGLVLYVEDSVSDQELMAFHLANVGIKVKAVSNVLAAVELAGQVKFDAVLANVWLPAMSGLELADFLRQNGYKGPIIALTADDRPEVQQDAHNHGCTTLLVKPYHFEELFAVLEPHLRHTQHKDVNETLMSEMWGDERMQPLIRSFLNRLKAEIIEMERQVAGGKAGLGLRKLCLDVKGSAGGYGFPRISESAQGVLELLMDEVGGKQLVAAFTELANLCRAACSLLEKEAIAASAPSAAVPSAQPEPADTKAA